MHTTRLVSEDPKIWVADDCVPQEFLDHVDAAFAAKDLGPRVVEKYDGRRILARNVDFEVDELSRGMFENIAKVLGITELDRCRDFMVSEVWADGQTSHVDHINLDDLAANKYNVDFLDLSKQSSSAGSPRRVVPTVSIVVYLNDVGGIRFPHAADEAGTIAAKCGRVVMFQNYDDVHRPAHKASAEHHGIYFKDMPKRILVMGLLANENPSMVGSNPPWQGLLYCAGTSRDPLFHDNPSYDTYKSKKDLADIYGPDSPQVQQRERMEAEAMKKQDLVLTMHSTTVGSEILVVGTAEGVEKVQVKCPPSATLHWLRGEAGKQVDKKSGVVLMVGQKLLTAEDDSKPLSEVFPEPTLFGLCSCLCPM